jgi:hypothetical protein
MAVRLHTEGELPPHDLEAEKQVLGACLMRPELLRDLDVTTADFFGEAHRIVWRELQTLAAEGEPIDTLHLRARLVHVGKLAIVGDDYLVGLTDTIPVSPPIDILRKLSRQRALRALGGQVSAAGAAGDFTAADTAIRAAKSAVDEATRPKAPLIEWRSTMDVFQPLPPVAWRVRGLQMCPGRPSMLAGYGASAKTLSAQALALAVASGTPAWDFFETAPGRVRHLDYEQGWRATARRYQRLAYGHRIEPGSLGDRLHVAVFPQVFLDSPDAVDAYSKLCDGVTLVILDALRGATPTQDENDSRIRGCIDNLSRVSEKTGCMFLVIHHGRKTQVGGAGDHREGLRGSSGIFDACGCVFTIAAGKGPSEPRLVHQSKPPAEAEGGPVEDFLLRVEDVHGPMGPAQGVRVLREPITKPDTIAANKAALDGHSYRLVEAVTRHPGKSREVVISMAGINKAIATTLLDELERSGVLRSSAGPRNARLMYPANRSQRGLGESPD